MNGLLYWSNILFFLLFPGLLMIYFIIIMG